MNEWYRLTSWLSHFLSAKGVNAIHSPFIFDFVKNVLHDQRYFYVYDEIEQLRSTLWMKNEKLSVTDYGASSSGKGPSQKTLRSVLTHSVKPPKQAQLLFRMVEHYGSKEILELGTSLGITTSYLASSSRKSGVVTLEGDQELAAIAQKNFESLGKKNIRLICGRFCDTLQKALEQAVKFDFIFFDGDHRKDATLNYFQAALPAAHEHSVFVFDDIYWSKEMTAAWNEIRSNEKVTASIDLYYMGILFFRKELSRQNFLLRL